MGIFSILRGKSGAEEQSFSFANGSTSTAKEFGFLAARTGLENSQQITDSWFGPDAFAARLGLASAICDRRFTADCFIAMLHAGIFVWHAQWKLRATELTLKAVQIGIADALGCVHRPSGETLTLEDKNLFLKAAVSFSRALETDIENSAKEQADAFRPGPSATAGMLLDILRRAYSSDAALVARWRDEMDSPSGIWLWQAVDNLLTATALGLQNDLRVQVVR